MSYLPLPVLWEGVDGEGESLPCPRDTPPLPPASRWIKFPVMRLPRLCLMVLSLLTALPAVGVAQQRPNVVLILSDDHAAHAISAYGSRVNQTPNLDRLAAGGVRFDRAYVTNSLCGPSRASFLTGQYAHRHGFKDNQRGSIFDNAQTTFPKLLQQAGYQTAVFGKWHLRSEPVGFDRWRVIHEFALYRNARFIENGMPPGTDPPRISGDTMDHLFDESLKWLRDGRDREKPFFLMITPQAPHRPWVPDEKHAALYEGQTIAEPPTFNDDLSTRGRAAHECRMSVLDDLKPTDLKEDPPADLSPASRKSWNYQRLAKDYLRTVAAMDDHIGRVLDELDRLDLARDTLVIYTSDNGFFLGDHGWFDKRFMYEPSMRVPLIARLPGVTPAGSHTDRLAVNVDVASTILDFAGAPVPGDMHGRSLRPVLKGDPPADWRASVYYHYYEQEPEHNVAPHYGVRTAGHKLIRFYTHDEWELYDLEKDPDELRNVAEDPAYAAVRAELTAELERLRKQYADNTP